MDWAYIFTLCWIAFMGIVPPFISAAVLGYAGYWYGKKQGEKQYQMSKDEIRAYIKGEFLQDLTTAVRDQINGMIGPIARGGTAEAKAEAFKYLQSNPGTGSLLMTVAAKAAGKWLGKQLGVGKEVSEMLGGVAPSMPFQFGKPKQDDLLKPVEPPHP